MLSSVIFVDKTKNVWEINLDMKKAILTLLDKTRRTKHHNVFKLECWGPAEGRVDKLKTSLVWAPQCGDCNMAHSKT